MYLFIYILHKTTIDPRPFQMTQRTSYKGERKELPFFEELSRPNFNIRQVKKSKLLY